MITSTNALPVASLPIAVIGAGPIGLAAAVHLLQRGLTPVVLEAGPSVAASLESYRHVRLFSPWRYNIDRAARELLDEAGWTAPDLDMLPSAGDIIDAYLQPLAALPALASHIRYRHQVLRIARQGFDKVKTKARGLAPFVIQVETPDGEREIVAASVIDASGTWMQPNPLGTSGLPARGEAALRAHIHYGMPDILGTARVRYAGKRVLVVGAGHSAAGNLIALAELARQAPGTRIVWALRGDNLTKIFGGGAADGLPARGQLGTRLQQLQQSGVLELHTNFRIMALQAGTQGIDVTGDTIDGAVPVIDEIDEIIAATGARPDLAMTRELRVRLDPWLESTDALAPLIDPNLHSCGTVRPHGHRELAHPEPGYYAVGAKSYGRAPNFLMATGYEQVRSIVAAMAGDTKAADDVQLELPETGICSAPSFTGKSVKGTGAACCGSSVVPAEPIEPVAQGAGCCGGPSTNDASACCVADAEAKASGRSGCGCSEKPVKEVKQEPAACCG